MVVAENIVVAEDTVAAEVPAAPRSELKFYVRRFGYSDIKFFEGDDPKGTEVAYFMKVSKRINRGGMGWDLSVHKGPDENAPEIFNIRKASRWHGWDKNSHVHINKARDGTAKEANETGEAVAQVSEEEVPQDAAMTSEGHIVVPASAEYPPTEVEDAHSGVVRADAPQVPQDKKEVWKKRLYGSIRERDPHEAAIMTRKHAFRSSAQEFEWKGRTYVWDYTVMVGGVITCKDVETGEVVATCKLLIGWSYQIVTSWMLRSHGPVTIMGSGLEMVDMLIATLACVLEWRKHNNKYIWLAVATIA